MLLAIDPGRSSGWALLDGNALRAAGTSGAPLHFPVATAIVAERPTVYPHDPKGVNPNNLITLAINLGVWLGLNAHAPAVMLVEPRHWKGQLPKDIHHRRVAALLAPEELLVWAPLGPDARDAVALGLWHVGRRIR